MTWRSVFYAWFIYIGIVTAVMFISDELKKDSIGACIGFLVIAPAFIIFGMHGLRSERERLAQLEKR